MEIVLHTIKVRDLIDGYVDNKEAGVIGLGIMKFWTASRGLFPFAIM